MATVAAGGSRRGRLRYVAERRGFLAAFLISPAVLFIAALVGVPFVLAIYLSFTNAGAGEITGKWVGLANFRRIFHDPIFRGSLWHTAEMTLISQAVVIVCAGLIAHALVHRFRGRWFLRFLILLPWAAPISLTVIGSRPAIIRSAVVLPQPEGPTKTTNSPSATCMSRPVTACVPSG